LEDPQQLNAIIQRCLKGDRESQKVLYEHFYGYAMSICLRYTRSREEAREILNDGFMKVFTRLNQHEDQSSFKAWLRRIMINTAIDQYRKSGKHEHHQDLEAAAAQVVSVHGDALDALSYGELVMMVQQLTPAYRTVFNLYVIDGYTHEEIAAQMGISVGTSKSNLFKAREQLRTLLKRINVKKYA
jgi:RNA polymerase sigma-70 factor (ECF subfamily)